MLNDKARVSVLTYVDLRLTLSQVSKVHAIGPSCSTAGRVNLAHRALLVLEILAPAPTSCCLWGPGNARPGATPRPRVAVSEA